MKDILYGISDISDFAVLEMEVAKNHVHILVESEPKISVLQIVRRLKQISTVKIWKKTFWSDGYFACPIGNAIQETVRKYIQSQG